MTCFCVSLIFDDFSFVTLKKQQISKKKNFVFPTENWRLLCVICLNGTTRIWFLNSAPTMGRICWDNMRRQFWTWSSVEKLTPVCQFLSTLSKYVCANGSVLLPVLVVRNFHKRFSWRRVLVLLPSLHRRPQIGLKVLQKIILNCFLTRQPLMFYPKKSGKQ